MEKKGNFRNQIKLTVIEKINNERRGYKNEYESNDANAVTAAFR